VQQEHNTDNNRSNRRDVSPRADHEGRGGDAGGVSRLGDRRHQFAARPDSPAPTRAAMPRWSTPCAPRHMFGYVNQLRSMSRDGPSTRCNSTITRRCHRPWQRKSRRNSLDRKDLEDGDPDGPKRSSPATSALQYRHDRHVDHGKTSLTAADHQGCSRDRQAKYTSYDQIDAAPEEKGARHHDSITPTSSTRRRSGTTPMSTAPGTRLRQE